MSGWCVIRSRHCPGRSDQNPGQSLLTAGKNAARNRFDPEKLAGIGIGIPGPVDFSQGTVVSPPIMPGWDQYPIIQTMQQWFPAANVVVDNDVNVMALGEIYQGAGKGVDNLIFIKIGTGIGAGIICEGEIYRGASGCAGDIGHISVHKNGPMCHCGNNGCLEAMAAGPAIAERAFLAAEAGKSPILLKYSEKNGGFLTAEDVGDAAREGDTLAIEIIRESGQYIGDVLASLVNFYNPDMIVIGGGVSNLGNLLLSSIRQSRFQPIPAAGDPRSAHRFFEHRSRRGCDRRGKSGHGLYVHPVHREWRSRSRLRSHR